MTQPGGGPAYPTYRFIAAGDKQLSEVQSEGVTIRDWFAGRVLPEVINAVRDEGPRLWAEVSYAIADAMLAERAK